MDKRFFWGMITGFVMLGVCKGLYRLGKRVGRIQGCYGPEGGEK